MILDFFTPTPEEKLIPVTDELLDHLADVYQNQASKFEKQLTFEQFVTHRVRVYNNPTTTQPQQSIKKTPN